MNTTLPLSEKTFCHDINFSTYTKNVVKDLKQLNFGLLNDQQKDSDFSKL